MKRLLASLLTTSIFGCVAYAGEAKVTWQEPDKYTDIREGNELRDSFREKLFKDFESVFADFAKQLPDGYLFEVSVTDIDLAGDVNPMRGGEWQNVRVVKDLYWPRMSFSYSLKDAAGGTRVSGTEDVKDLGFLSSSVGLTRTRFGYEERMLENWFKKQLREGKFPARANRP